MDFDRNGPTIDFDHEFVATEPRIDELNGGSKNETYHKFSFHDGRIEYVFARSNSSKSVDELPNNLTPLDVFIASINPLAGGGVSLSSLKKGFILEFATAYTKAMVFHLYGTGMPEHLKGERFTGIPEDLIVELRYKSAPYHQSWTQKSIGDCFLTGTSIFCPDGLSVPIESIRSGTEIQSYDARGALVPARVTRTMTQVSTHILDLHGTMITPGHVTLCGTVEGEANPFAGRHVPVLDILRTDGALVKADGS